MNLKKEKKKQTPKWKALNNAFNFNFLILWNISNTLVLLAIALQNDLGNLAVKTTYLKNLKQILPSLGILLKC